MNEFPFPPDRPAPPSLTIVLAMLLLPVAQTAALVYRSRTRPHWLDTLGWVAAYFAGLQIFERTWHHPSLAAHRQLFALSVTFLSMLALCRIQIRSRNPQKSVGTGWCLSAIYAVALTAIFGSVVFFPLTTSREPARRAQCRNNLKQIGLALWEYEIEDGQFIPPVVMTSGLPDRSWRVDLLPSLDERKAFEAYRKDLPWNSPENDRLLAPSVYRCPSSRQSSDEKLTAYAMVTDSTSVDGQPAGGFHQKVAADQSNSICLLEVCGLQLKWQQPRDVDIAREAIGINLPGDVPNTSPAVLSSYHTAGANVLLTDGTVRFLSEKTDPDVLRAMMTPGRNNEVVSH